VEAGVRDDVGYQDLRGYLKQLENAGLLKRIDAEVDLKYEIGAICGLGIDRKQPGLLFENIKDHPGRPLAANIMYSLEQLAVAFNTEPSAEQIQAILIEGMKHRLASVVVEDGPCKQERHFGEDVNLYDIPSPWWHEGDGGQYLATQAGCITRHPETGILNCGTYKCMIVDRNTLTLTSGMTRVGHIRPNEAKDQPTPIVLAIGMDPLLTLASGTVIPVDGQEQMEFEAAGAWRGTPTVLVKAETSDILVPAYAEYIVEGEVIPHVRIPEGPHGESTGFYGSRLQAYEIKVKAITHRKDPIAYGLICRQFEDYPRWLFRSSSFLHRLRERSGLDNLKEVYFPDFVGWGWGFGIIRADVQAPGEARRIIEAAWELQPQRWMIVVDEDCDALDMNEVLWRVICSVEPSRDLFYGPITPFEAEDAENVDKPVPTQPLGFDATFHSKGIKFAPINSFSRDLRASVNARWKELGLSL
jgi:UbiD family decarboxylase